MDAFQIDMLDLKNEIIAYALRNAIEFGSVDAGKILPKLFQHGLDKKDIKQIMPQIVKEVENVNAMSDSERKKKFEDYSKFLKEKVEEEKGLPDLPEVSSKMIFRLAPFPSGAMHLGNAKTYLLNALYAEKYKAKLLLVMDDTIGSEEKQVLLEAYNLIEEGWKLLNVKYNKPVIYKSDRVEIYYKYADELIKKDKAYVCHCPQEILRDNRARGVECLCRGIPIEEQMKRWKEMFSASEGSAVLRIKTSMQHPNPAFRDRVLFKISDRKHPRVGNKYRVWPTLEMSWAIDDHELGITHILRGNDLMIETDMEKYIWDIFGWKYPVTIHTGMVRIEGMGAKLSKSKAQKEVSSGEFFGWDDPRTWSVQSLIRRGIKAEALRAFVEEIGLNRQDIHIPVDALYSINRKMIDSETNRYYFVENPVKLNLDNRPEIEVADIPIHPDKKETRTVRIKDIYVSGKDFENFKNKEVRLLHLYNVLLGEKSKFTSLDNKPIQKIQWVSESVSVKILMPDGSWISGIGESSLSKIKSGEMVQFERFGFCRFDQIKDGIYEFWFAH